MEDDKWKLKLTSVLCLRFYIHIGGLKKALKSSNVTLRPVFIASILPIDFSFQGLC